MSKEKSNNPRIAFWLLKSLVPKDELPFLTASFQELYREKSLEKGKLYANLWLRKEIIKSLPGLLSANLYWRINMFKNYFKIVVRNLYKNKLYSFINIFGLGVAVAICIAGYINYQFSQSFDAFHENADNIYLVNTYRIVNNNRQDLSTCPTPMAGAVKDNMPGIDNFSRLARGGAIIRYKDKVFNESIYYVDENFFDIFTFPLLKGNKNALKDMNSLIITDEIAQKYFGKKNPIGKQILLSPNGEKEYTFIVQGVIRKPSYRSSIRLSICAPYERQEDILGYKLKSWRDWTSAAFIQTGRGTSPTAIEGHMQTYVNKTNQANPQFPVNGFFLTGLPDLSTISYRLGGSPFKNGFKPSQIIAPSVIAFLVLLLACFNFVNTAIAYSSRRLKEIGIRKVIGGMRGQLIMQFLSENLVLCSLALILGLILAGPFVNFYSSLFPDTVFTLSYADNPGLLIFIIGLLLFTGIASGAYPALYVSRFNPISIFRGKQKLGGTNRLIRVLLTLQFVISIAAILSGIMFYKNSEFIKNYDLGFDKEQVLVVPVRNETNYRLLKNSLKNNPHIISTAASEHVLGYAWTTRDIEAEQTKLRIDVLDIGEKYFETTGLKLLEGTSFNPDKKAEAAQSVIISETMKKTLGWSSAVGKYIRFNAPPPGKEYRVIGVAKDFYLRGVWRKVGPVALRSAPADRTRYLSLKFNLDRLQNVSAEVRKTWKKLFPHLPYNGFFQDEVLAEATKITESIGLLFQYIALIVILTSGMGLFALVSLNIVKRTKEIGIRRVLGASFRDISYLLSREFMVLLVIAGVLGSLLGYYLIKMLMSDIWAYYVSFGIIPFLGSFLMMFAIAMVTVGSKVFSVATDNPVKAIRYE